MPKNRKSPAKGAGNGGFALPNASAAVARGFDLKPKSGPPLPAGPRHAVPVIRPLRLPGKGRGG